MSRMPVGEDDLHAYVDAQLNAARRAEVEEFLAQHPEEAARVQAWRQQTQALRALFDPVLDETLPPALQALAETPATQERGLPRWSLLRIAAGFMLALLGGVAGWLAHGQYPAAGGMAQAVPLPRQAAVAHVVFSPEVKRPVEVSGAQEDQLVTWLSKRLGTPVHPPKLGGLGYELVGGRLLPGNAGPVAQFMYQEVGGQRLTLYVTTEGVGNRDTAFRFSQEGNINVFYWVDGPFGYALSGSIAKADLAGIAMAVHQQLGRP